MKKLSEPKSLKAITVLDDTIKRKRKEDYAKRLRTYKNYIINRYYIYEQAKNTLENVGASEISSEEDKNAIHSSFNTVFKKKMKSDELKKVYEECEGVCPYCGDGRIEEVDHYVPKEDYPEFTLYPNNLIPLCNKCNKKKGSKFIDSRNERQFINFYYDNIDSIEFLSVDISFNSMDIKKSTKVKYIADFSKIADEYLRKIVQHHYDYLELLCRYNEAAIYEISELIAVLQGQPTKNSNDIRIIANGWILGKRNNQIKKAGRNDWKYLLYEKLYTINYVDELIKYVCTEDNR
jgi:hypothetical protein